MLKKLTFLAAFSSMFLTACSPSVGKNADDGRHIHVAPILADTTATPADKAERLAKAAEQLLTVQGFAYASDIADLALAQDPKNLRAQFIKALLGPILAQKGIAARVAPLAAKNVQLQDAYDNAIATLEQKYPDSTPKSFMLDGTGDIASEQDLQTYVDTVAASFDGLRQFAKNNKDANLTIMTTDIMFEGMEKRLSDACVITSPNWYEYVYSCPSPFTRSKLI